ncbi:hypothetical protein [Achromobacter denitrificans]|uniref:hypothetical protein n=1 Tax=Achromobacter denitrificans TaxID=32002 RepID=UPI0023E775D2|nr:hypothetical protein [Achromobacter denitrificans]MDF3849435.1 hypothetical protein [Achromobacter denitrificans]
MSDTTSTKAIQILGWYREGSFPALFTDSVAVVKQWLEQGHKVSGVIRHDGLAVEAAPNAPAAGDALALPELNADLIDILGRPNFTCIRIAQLLRLSGVEIDKKAEAEQATVIHYLLGFYLKHGSQWAEKAGEDIERLRLAAIAAQRGKGGEA